MLSKNYVQKYEMGDNIGGIELDVYSQRFCKLNYRLLEESREDPGLQEFIREPKQRCYAKATMKIRWAIGPGGVRTLRRDLVQIIVS